MLPSYGSIVSKEIMKSDSIAGLKMPDSRGGEMVARNEIRNPQFTILIFRISGTREYSKSAG